MRAELENPPPIMTVALLVVAVVAVALLGWRAIAVHQELVSARDLAAHSNDLATDSVLGSLSLPSNRPLRFCNPTGTRVQVTALAAAYWAEDGTLRQFNSAEHGWRDWSIEPRQNQTMSADPVWDGSTVFYAAEVKRGDRPVSLLAGTSSDWKGANCVPLGAE